MKRSEVAGLLQELRKHNLERKVLRFLKARLPRRTYVELRDELLNQPTAQKPQREPVGGWAWD